MIGLGICEKHLARLILLLLGVRAQRFVSRIRSGISGNMAAKPKDYRYEAEIHLISASQHLQEFVKESPIRKGSWGRLLPVLDRFRIDYKTGMPTTVR